MEYVQQFGPNVVVFHLVTKDHRCYILGCLLAPDDTLTIESVVAALKERPLDAELLVAGDFNVKLSEQEGDRKGEDIAAALATEELEDISAHFLPHRLSRCLDGRTWSMIREGREVRSRVDYILGSDCRLFWNVSFRDLMYNSYNYMVLGCLCSAPLMEHFRYLRGGKRLLLNSTYFYMHQ